MAKAKSQFICQSCGAVYSRWQGRCEACGEWNSIAEEVVESGVGASPNGATAGGRPTELVPLAGETESAVLVDACIAEVRYLGALPQDLAPYLYAPPPLSVVLL